MMLSSGRILGTLQTSIVKNYGYRKMFSVLATASGNNFKARYETPSSTRTILPNLCPATNQPSLQQRATFFKDIDVSKMAKYDPDMGNLVYVGTMSPTVKLVKVFSLSTSAICLAFQPFLYHQLSNLPLALQLSLGGSFGFLVFFTPVLLHWITGRYVTKMYLDYKTDKFTTFNFSLFAREKAMTFELGDNVEPQVAGVLCTVKANGKSLFLDPQLFLDNQAYIKLMGYDKPIDWAMPSKQKDQKDE